MANTLADVRKEFVRISRRFDLVTSGDLVTNADNGANYFINLGQRWLDRRTKRRNRNRKFLKVLAVGDFSFTVPEFSEFSSFRMLTATAELKLTDKQMTIEAFRDTYGRPYTGWINGKPNAWAIDLDTMPPLHESGIPPDALGQQTTRALPTEGDEMLSNESFATLAGGSISSFTAPTTYIGQDAEGWQRGDADIEITGGSVVASSDTLADGTFLVRQHIEDMLKRPQVNTYYLVSLVLTGYSAGSLSVTLGDVDTTDDASEEINANGTWTTVLRPTSFDSVPFFQVVSRTAGSATFSVDSVSLKEIGPYPSTLIPTSEQRMDFDDASERVGVIFYPPAENATTAEFAAFFYTPKLTVDTEKSYWTIHHEDLLALASALQAEKRLGSGARIDYFLKAMEVDLGLIDEEELQWEMDGWDMQDYMGRLGH